MNKGIDLAEGEFLIFMNSNDEFENEDILKRISDIVHGTPSKPTLIYGDSIDVDENNVPFYRKAKKGSFIKMGMITQHQAMFFNHKKISDFKYSDEYLLSADYALIASVIKKAESNEILKLEFPICKFKMGGANESQRFRAIKEDYLIRRKELNLSFAEAGYLYLLHYIHALIKHSFKKTRFLRHKPVMA
jgi:hypothetical protein